MRDAINSQDREFVRSLAHKLKGGSGQVGAHKVASICLEFEAEASEASWETLAKMLVSLTQERSGANEELNVLWFRESA